MLIKVKELCWVTYINKENVKKNIDEKLTAIRIVAYKSPKDTLLEAFEDYDSCNFDKNNIVWLIDEFNGECLTTIKYISVEEIEPD